MKHADAQTLARLSGLLAALRADPRLKEPRPGVFYRRGRAFLHFHEHHGEIHADLRAVSQSDFTRLSVDPTNPKPLLAAVLALLEGG